MTAWNGIPDDPGRDGWHWIDHTGWLEPRYWFVPKPPVTNVGYWRGGSPDDPAPWLNAGVRYIGPCDPRDKQ